jgi:hypothetical protein
MPPRSSLRAVLSAAALAALAPGCAALDGEPARAPSAKVAAPPAPQRGVVRKGTPDGVNVALARARDQKQLFEWVDIGPAAFEKARRENKFILLDGAAAWCHWCHVMDETTYADPEVGREIAAHFVAIRVDIDQHPDIAERYGDYGWPATIVFSPRAEELGKYRGYLTKADLLEILRAMSSVKPEAQRAKDPFDVPPPLSALPWIAGRVVVDMDGYYDEQQAGWGQMQKPPLGLNVVFELRRYAHGDAAAGQRAVATLAKHHLLVDPVWGGIYQYSTGRLWNEPHYEKLMTYQAWNLEAFARGYAMTKRPELLADARKIAGYLSTFLSNADGAFLVSQDADVNAHDEKKAFVDGDVYYRLDDAHRRALGIPRIDDAVYGHENGLAIAAFVALHEATGDADALARARRAADFILRAKTAPDGAIVRKEGGPRYLADQASMGFALARLAEVTKDARYEGAAKKVADAMVKDLADPESGALFDRSIDPAAAGVFARRARPFIHEILAVRFLTALGRVTGDAAWTDRAKKLLVATCTPKELDERGRMVGDVLLALDDLGQIAW